MKDFLEKIRLQQTDSRFKHNQRIAKIVFDQWLDDQFQGKGNYNPFARIIEETIGEPPYIPPVVQDKN